MIMSMKEKKLNIKIDPDLTKLETGYSVPEGYFESFGDRLKLRMEAEEVIKAPIQNQRSRGLLIYLRPALGLAAGLALLVTIFLYPSGDKNGNMQAYMQDSANVVSEDLADPLSNTYASLISDGQFFLALIEMDDYDASKISKDELADYLVSNCSDIEIFNDDK
jgi:hypothetical protein